MSSRTSFKGTIKNLNKFIGWKSTLAYLDEHPLENSLPYLVNELLEHPHSRASKRILTYLGNNRQISNALSLYLMTPKSEPILTVIGKILLEIQELDDFFLDLFNQPTINASYQQLKDLLLIKENQKLIDSVVQILIDNIAQLLPKISIIYNHLLYILVRERKNEFYGSILNVLTDFFYANEAEPLIDPLIQQFSSDIIPLLFEKLLIIQNKEKNFLRLIQFLKTLDNIPLPIVLESLIFIKRDNDILFAFLDELYQYLHTHNEQLPLVFEQLEKSDSDLRKILSNFLKRFGKEILLYIDNNLEHPLSPDIFDEYLHLYNHINQNLVTNRLIQLITTINGRLAARELQKYGSKVFPVLVPLIESEISLDASTFIALIFLNHQIEALDILLPLIETSTTFRSNPIIIVFLQHLDKNSAIYLTEKILLSFKESFNYYWQFLKPYTYDVCTTIINRISKETDNKIINLLNPYVTFFLLGEEISLQVLEHKLEDQNNADTILLNLIKLYENKTWYISNLIPLLAYDQYESKIQVLIRPNILTNLGLLQVIFSILDSSPPVLSSGLKKFLVGIGDPVVEPLFQRVLKTKNENFVLNAVEVLVALKAYKEVVNILNYPIGRSQLPLLIKDIEKILPYILQSSAGSHSSTINPNLYNIFLQLPEELVFISFTEFLNKEASIQDSLTLKQYFLTNYQFVLQEMSKIYSTSSITVQSWFLYFSTLKPKDTLKYFKTLANDQKEFLQISTVHNLIKSIVYGLSEELDFKSKESNTKIISLIENLSLLGAESLSKYSELFKKIDPSNSLLLNTMIQNLEYIGTDSLPLLIEILSTGSNLLLDQLFIAFNHLVPKSVHSLLNIIIMAETSKKLTKRVEDILLRMDYPDIIQLSLQFFGIYSLDYQNSALLLFLEKKIKSELIVNPDSTALKMVINELGNDNPFVRAAAHEMCVLMGEKSIPILINVLENYDQPSESLYIINILQTLSSFSQSSILPLINLLYHSNSYVKRMAIHGLVIIGEKSVNPLLDLLLDDQKISKDLIFSIFNQMGETAVKDIIARLKTLSNLDSLILLIDALNETHSLHASNTLVDLLNYPNLEVQKHAEMALHGLLINQESFGKFLSQMSESLMAKAENRNKLIQCTGCGEYILPNSNYCNHCLTPQVPFKCAICTGSDVTKLLAECPHCKHLFHLDHILNWFETKDICPVCREKLSTNLIRVLWICPNENCKRRNDLALPYCSKCKRKNPFLNKDMKKMARH